MRSDVSVDEGRARHAAQQALAADLADSLLSSPEGVRELTEMLLAGFPGILSLTDRELIVALYEAGLDERQQRVLEALEQAALLASEPEIRSTNLLARLQRWCRSFR